MSNISINILWLTQPNYLERLQWIRKCYCFLVIYSKWSSLNEVVAVANFTLSRVIPLKQRRLQCREEKSKLRFVQFSFRLIKIHITISINRNTIVLFNLSNCYLLKNLHISVPFINNVNTNRYNIDDLDSHRFLYRSLTDLFVDIPKNNINVRFISLFPVLCYKNFYHGYIIASIYYYTVMYRKSRPAVV